MKKYLVGVIVLFAFFFTQTSDVFASCGANLTIDLQKQSRDYFTDGQVTVLQNFLKVRGFLQSDVTGFFGNDTYSAVRGYQIANGISPASGFVGALTRASINTELCTSSSQGEVLGVETSSIPVPSLTVISPNGGEQFPTKGRLKVKWQSSNISDRAGVSIGVRSYGLFMMMGEDGREHSVTYKDFSLKSTRNDGSETVRYNLPPGKYKMFIKTQTGNTTSTVVHDFGDQTFDVGISEPTVRAVAVYGSEESSEQLVVRQGESFSVIAKASNLDGINPGYNSGNFSASWKFDSILNGMCSNDDFRLIKESRGWKITCTPNKIGEANIYSELYVNNKTYTSNNLKIKVVPNVSSSIKVSYPNGGEVFGNDNSINDDLTIGVGYVTSGVGNYLEINLINDNHVIVAKKVVRSVESSRSITDGRHTETISIPRDAVVSGIPNGKYRISVGDGMADDGLHDQSDDYFTINRKIALDGKYVVSGIEIDNLKTSYKVGAPVVYKIEGETKSQSVSNWLRTATPSQGFAARAAIEEYDAVGKQWFTRSNLINTADMSAVGVWDGKDRWDIKMKAPLDATKTYRVRSIVYCANRALGCISGEGAVVVDTQAITVTVDTPPVVVTTPLPTMLSESDVINNIKSDAQKIKSALVSYYGDNGSYPPGEMPMSTLVSSKYLGKYLSSAPKFSVEGITSFPVDASSATYYYARSENGLQCGKGGTDKSFVAESKDLPYILLFNAKPDTAEKSYYGPAKYFNRAWFSKRDMYPAHWSYCL